MLFLWYCVDDYVARMSEMPELGSVPFHVVLVFQLIFMSFLVMKNERA